MNDPFATTRWSVVLAAGRNLKTDSTSAALETLCSAYWFPIYSYIRRHVSDRLAAQDVTQSFFGSILEKGLIGAADPDRGRFRAFLLTACRRFLANEEARAAAAKRGGRHVTLSLNFEDAERRYENEPAVDESPDQHFERQWANTLLSTVLQQLRQEYLDRDRAAEFDALKGLLAGTSRPYADIAAELGRSVGAVKVAVHRLRERYRELIRSEISQTVDSPADIDEELQRLYETLTRP